MHECGCQDCCMHAGLGQRLDSSSAATHFLLKQMSRRVAGSARLTLQLLKCLLVETHSLHMGL